ncbi:Similar to Amino-acid transporter arg-13; acc. no. Q01356 [Pyronema omphalodes CBS 100304]|uniref:Similar to Amino-acid transporter arg-13 acc. no. Q01356 n=1 Tax=Pyronema omphalodes (strain CBS 100304) TaxID=1076935 RepID=U4LRN9_PYROM|nr:Similar to Amino-acid transporter arg-13; acc. no. Q01356 [Pyronema omphalodes CBS 100304]
MSQERHIEVPQSVVTVPIAPAPLMAEIAPAAMDAPITEATSITAAKDIAYGSLAGMIGKVIEYPFDTVKVRLQSQPDTRPLLYKGPLDCFLQGVRQDGIRGLYRGISSPMVGAAAENSCLFFSYNLAQTFTRSTFYPHLNPKDPLPLSALLWCGSAAGAFASFVLTPIELIKCKVQVQAMESSGSTASKPGPIGVMKEVWKHHGIKGFWNGQTGTFLRETGGSACWFGAYEYVGATLRKRKGSEQLGNGEMMLAGAAAGVSYNFMLFPADSIKSRMQTQVLYPGEKAKGFLEITSGMYKAGGIKAFYRGCGITCFRSAPSSAVIFLCYEKLKEWF